MTSARDRQPAIRTAGLTRHVTRVVADHSAGRLKARLGDLVTLGFGSEADAIVAAEGATWALGDGAVVERNGTTVRTRAPGAADRVARFVVDLDAAGSPVRRVEVSVSTR